MKIAVLGAPGSGKSDFADALADLLMDQTGRPWGIIDDAVTELRHDTGQEYGMLGNHLDDLQVAFKRREFELVIRDQDFITVGTILDTAAHWMARSEVVKDDEAALSQIKLQAIAATFGMLYTDTWDYDYAFLVSRVSDFTQGGYPHAVQFTLESLVATYRAPVFTFKDPEASSEQKVKLAADAIRALEKDPIAPTPERGVRRGGEDGEADGDSSEPVPDVPEQGTD
jgi:energy-coupling factor transporter ATP-binding protein EcfA2